GLFNLLVDSVSLLTDATCGKTGSRTVTVGAHTVTETEGTGTSIANYGSITGGNCAPDGTITLGLGQSATCTITNVRPDPSSPQPATWTVNKTCDPSGDNGLFDLYVDDRPRFPDVDCGGSTGAVTVAAGAHTVREGSGSETSLGDYTTVIGGDCAANGSVTIA